MKSHHDTVWYNTRMHTAWQCQRWDMDQISNSENTPHSSPMKTRLGVSFVGVWVKIDSVIMSFNPHLIPKHYGDDIMGAIASQITSLTIVYSTIYSDADQRKHQSSASLAICVGNSPGTSEFPTQMSSNVENVSICWRNHGAALWGMFF